MSGDHRRKEATPTRAVLVFADSLPLDLMRRKWPASLKKLLSVNILNDLAENSEFDTHLFTRPESDLSNRSQRIHIHFQQRGSFARDLEAAVEKLARLGYEQIVIVGRDCPELSLRDIEESFRLLEKKRLVLGPDHRGGVYLIGLRSSDRSLMWDVTWQKDTDCWQLSQRLPSSQVCLLSVKHDLDSFEDLLLLAASRSPWRWLALACLQSLVGQLRLSLRPRQRGEQEIDILTWQLPPPPREPAVSV